MGGGGERKRTKERGHPGALRVRASFHQGETALTDTEETERKNGFAR